MPAARRREFAVVQTWVGSAQENDPAIMIRVQCQCTVRNGPSITLKSRVA